MLLEATRSKWTHVGVVAKDPVTGQLSVFEASSKVKFSSLTDFVGKSHGAQVSVKRLDPAVCAARKARDPAIDCNIGVNFNAKIGDAVEKFHGKNYDRKFQESDDTIYCSELVDKVFRESFGIEIAPYESFQNMFGLKDGENWRDLEHDPQRRHVFDAIMARFGPGGRDFQQDALVVSPVAQYNSELLQTVYECEERVQSGRGRNHRSSE